MDYIAYLHKDRKSDIGVSFPDFPGCVTAGRTLEDARRKAQQVLALHIHGMIEDGDRIPKPSKLDDIANDPARKGAVAFLVSAEPDVTERINITAPRSQILEIDRRAEEAGLTRSAFIVQSITGIKRAPRRRAKNEKSRKSRSEKRGPLESKRS